MCSFTTYCGYVVKRAVPVITVLYSVHTYIHVMHMYSPTVCVIKVAVVYRIYSHISHLAYKLIPISMVENLAKLVTRI